MTRDSNMLQHHHNTYNASKRLPHPDSLNIT